MTNRKFGYITIGTLLAGFGLATALVACSGTTVSTALSSPAGELFCSFQAAGGGTVVAGIIDAEATALAPAAGPVAILATGATKTFVDNACNQAAANTGATGAIPVSPPANPAAAPTVAVLKSKVAS